MKKRIAIWSILLPLLACCTVQEPVTVPEAPASRNDSYVQGEAILLLSEEGADAFDPTVSLDALKELGVYTMERVFPEAGEFEERHRAAGLHRWYKVSYDPSVSRTKAGGELSTIPGVEAVTFQPKIERRGYFNDPYLRRQWNYFNDGSNGMAYMAGMDINVVPVWEKYTTGSKNVIVAVIDGGVQADHPDLKGVVLSAEEGSQSFIRGHDHNELFVDDHGTHVASTIAAINNNGVGGCGVAGGNDGQGGVRIMACNIFSDDEKESSDEAAALVWAADHGAVIANNSWGYTFDTEAKAAAGAESFLNEESALKSAIDYFIENAGTDAKGNQVGLMKGGLAFFASGNSGFAHDAPGEYDKVIAVGAFGPDGKMPLFSNYGPWVDILAPGGSDSDAPEEWILSAISDSKYGFMAGTSMACPHVAGVAALLLSYFGGPGFTADMLKEALLSGAEQNVIDLQKRTVSGGKLDALGAFSVLDESENPDASDIVFTTNYDGDWRLKSHESLDVNVNIAGNGRAKLPVSFSTNCPGATAECTPRQASLHIEALLAEPGVYTATFSVGTIVTKSYPFTILPNHAPELLNTPDDMIVNAATAASTTLDMSRYFTDPDGESLVYQLKLDGDPIVTSSLSGSQLTISTSGYGMANVTLTALDGRKASASTTFNILARNTFQDVDVFPNPVVDKLNIRPGSDRTVSVELVNAAGATVYTEESVQIGPFKPLSIDMSAMPGGVYALIVNGQRFTVVKK